MTGTTSFSSRAPPGEETQTKLNALSNQFDNFFGDLEEETAVRKKAEDSRVTRIERELGRLEKAINVETRRRIEATKAIQLQYEEKLEAMQTSFREQIKASTDALRAEIRGLHDHIARLEARMDEERENREREIQRHNHDVLSKFDAHTKEFEIEKASRTAAAPRRRAARRASGSGALWCTCLRLRATQPARVHRHNARSTWRGAGAHPPCAREVLVEGRAGCRCTWGVSAWLALWSVGHAASPMHGHLPACGLAARVAGRLRALRAAASTRLHASVRA